MTLVNSVVPSAETAYKDNQHIPWRQYAIKGTEYSTTTEALHQMLATMATLNEKQKVLVYVGAAGAHIGMLL